MTPDTRARAVVDEIVAQGLDTGAMYHRLMEGVIAHAIQEAVQAERERCHDLVRLLEEEQCYGFPELRFPIINGGVTLEKEADDNLF